MFYRENNILKKIEYISFENIFRITYNLRFSICVSISKDENSPLFWEKIVITQGK